MGNERLRTAMAKARVDVEAVSSKAGVDPKTVQRWLGGRVPHARHRWAVSELLSEEETYLWPETTNARRATEASKAELVELYPFRSAVPTSLWWNLFSRAQRQIDVLVYAANFLHEQYPTLNDLLREKTGAGCKVRIALGDPDSEAVKARGAEERFGHGIETRCQVAVMHYQPLIGVPGIEVHLHRTTLYNSIYRADDDLLVNAHVWGVNAYSAPVTHLRRVTAGSLFDTYAASFEAVWATSEAAPRPSEA
jgi:hypothetical protein